jgi:predicted neutral ceramidase superfamily lipid hydrolase
MSTNNHVYGTGRNKADYFPTMGRKTKNVEDEIAKKVAEEMRERERQIDA